MNIKKHFYFFSMNDFSLTDGETIRGIGIIEALAADYPIYNIGQLTVQDEEKLPEGVSTIDSIVSDYLVVAGFSATDDEYDWELDADNDRWGI